MLRVLYGGLDARALDTSPLSMYLEILGGYYYCLHFTYGKTESQGGWIKFIEPVSGGIKLSDSKNHCFELM